MYLPSASQFWLDYGIPLSRNVPNALTARIAPNVIKYLRFSYRVNLIMHNPEVASYRCPMLLLTKSKMFVLGSAILPQVRTYYSCVLMILHNRSLHIQSREKRLVCNYENFLPALAQLFCLALPGSSLSIYACLIPEPCR